MYIRIIKDTKNKNGKMMPVGTELHVTNDYAQELIAAGNAQSASDPENYAPYTENEGPENELYENDSEEIPNKPEKSPSKKGKKSKKNLNG